MLWLYDIVEKYISAMGFSRREGEEVRKSIHIKINLLQISYQTGDEKRIKELEKRFDELSRIGTGEPLKLPKSRKKVREPH